MKIVSDIFKVDSAEELAEKYRDKAAQAANENERALLLAKASAVAHTAAPYIDRGIKDQRARQRGGQTKPWARDKAEARARAEKLWGEGSRLPAAKIAEQIVREAGPDYPHEIDTVKGWIRDLAPPELRRGGRPRQ